ncbi:MAG: DUF368 domain-containing protein [Candidatus Nanohaloarchaea archaeon]|nr:DUF368 domain-containing protein [Candidatus Nanohaloarchaea archaeon]
MEAESDSVLEVYVKGLLMGAADTIPGVSGGTIALITGIYARLVQAISSIDAVFILDLLRFRGGFWEDLREADVPFLVVLGLGVATSVALLSGLMHSALETYPAPMNALFLGLIGASAVVVFRGVSVDSYRPVLSASLGFAAAFLVTGFSASGSFGHSLPVVFLVGAVASAAMLLPGISGAAFLYVLGQYEYLTGVVSGFAGSFLAGSWTGLTSRGAVVAVFLSGVLVGLATISRAVSYSLRRSRDITMAFLIGLMLGALRLPVENISVSSSWNPAGSAAVIVSAAAGASTVLIIDRMTDDVTTGKEGM